MEELISKLHFKAIGFDNIGKTDRIFIFSYNDISYFFYVDIHTNILNGFRIHLRGKVTDLKWESSTPSLFYQLLMKERIRMILEGIDIISVLEKNKVI